MATAKQVLGAEGETLVAKTCACPKCKQPKRLKRLPPMFQCADVICEFCGYLAQVKTHRTRTPEVLPKSILGAAWGPQRERMEAAIYFPIFVVLAPETGPPCAIFYLSADLQDPAMFVPRNPLSKNARRAGWTGFHYDLSGCRDRFVRLL